MKLRFDAIRGCRIKNQFYGMEDYDCNWYWCEDKKSWVMDSDGHTITSHAPCKSVRAFRRMLKKAPSGVTFKLWTKYVGCNVYGVGSSKVI